MVNVLISKRLLQVFCKDWSWDHSLLVFINDIDSCTNDLLIESKFPDDTKLCYHEADHLSKEEALDNLVARHVGYGFQHSQMQGTACR